MKLTIRHSLNFSRGTPARAVQHVLLTALPTPQQKIERWSIEMPGFAEAAMFRDGFGNRAYLVSQVKPEPEMTVVIAGVAETTDKAGVLGRLEYDPPPALFRRRTEAIAADPALVEGLADGPDRIAMFHELMDRVNSKFGGAQQMQSADGQSQSQNGVPAKPQAFAEAFVGAARGFEIPARYVTGYLLEEDLASFHAWAEAWDDRLGWIGFDPALNVCPADNYVRIACGLDAMGTLPIRSVPAWHEMPVETVEISVA